MLPDTSLKKYSQRVTSLGSQLCIGLDSDVRRLPEQFAHHRFPQFAFNRWIIDQTAESDDERTALANGAHNYPIQCTTESLTTSPVGSIFSVKCLATYRYFTA
jgi:hypothetical protein